MRSQFVDQKLVPSLGPQLWQRSSTFRRPSEGSAQAASSAAVPLATHDDFQGHVGVGRQAGHLGRGQAPMKHSSHVACTGMVRGVNGRGFHTSCMSPLYTYTIHLINLQIYVEKDLEMKWSQHCMFGPWGDMFLQAHSTGLLMDATPQ